MTTTVSIGKLNAMQEPQKNAVVVPGQPKPKPRPRFNKHTGRAYSDTDQRLYEQYVGILLRRKHKIPLLGDVRVSVEFYRANRIRVDIDNLLKSVLDASNKIVFKDDSQVKEIHATIHIDKQNPRSVIIIEPME